MDGTLYILLALVIVGLGAIIVLLYRQRRGWQEADLQTLLDSLKSLSAVESQVNTLANAQTLLTQNLSKLEVSLKALETKLAETTGDVKEVISKDVGDARKLLVELRTKFEDEARRTEDLREVTRRIERVLVGARSRGASGENILAEAFAEFPPEMIERNYRIGGRVVEYAIVLPNKKRLPVDSKWGGANLLERLEKETDPDSIKRIEAELEREVEKKVREVSGYIEPSATANIAIAAVPDSVYLHCRKVHMDAFKVGVLLMAYSMVVPYVLALYHLHLQFARSIDYENIESYLTRIERSLDELDKVLENKIARAGTMAANAYNECKQLIGSMRAATSYLRELPSGEGNTPE